MKWIKLYENFNDDNIEEHLKNITSTRVIQDVQEILISDLGISPGDAQVYSEPLLKNLSDELIKQRPQLRESLLSGDNKSLVTLYLNSLEKAWVKGVESVLSTLRGKITSGLSREEFSSKITPKKVSGMINLVILSITENFLSDGVSFNLILKTHLNFYARRIIDKSLGYFYS
jgi:hypothetical protein